MIIQTGFVIVGTLGHLEHLIEHHCTAGHYGLRFLVVDVFFGKIRHGVASDSGLEGEFPYPYVVGDAVGGLVVHEADPQDGELHSICWHFITVIGLKLVCEGDRAVVAGVGVIPSREPGGDYHDEGNDHGEDDDRREDHVGSPVLRRGCAEVGGLVPAGHRPAVGLVSLIFGCEGCSAVGA